MKILRISFKNLNSLRGEWHIDLTNNIYTSEGIFAITGPTGAGKTTIFDAVCLALYGRTPRLATIGGKNNEIMSRGTGECYSSVTFSTDKGIFTCRWEQTRAHKNSSGRLQDVKHKLDGEHIPLTMNSTETIKEVEKITGMDFARFIQAMMLRQGGFDAFLTADKNDRAKILELITGTDIYSKISMLVFQRSKDERAKLDAVNLKLCETKSLLGNDSPDKISTELESCSAQLEKLRAAHNETIEARDLLREIGRLQNDLGNQKRDMNTIQRRAENFEADRIRLELAERAESIRHIHSELDSVSRTHDKSHSTCETIKHDVSICKKLTAELEAEVSRLEARISEESCGFTELPDVVRQRTITAVLSYEDSEKAKRKLKTEVVTAEKKLKEAEAALREKLALRNQAREKMDSLSQEQKDVLNELMSIRAMTTEAVMNEQRAKLRPGMPCPLCGSVEHPGIEHEHSTIITQKADELFRQSEMIEAKLNQLAAGEKEAEKNYERASEEYNNAVSNESSAQTKLRHLQEELEKKTSETKNLHYLARQAVQPFNFTDVKSCEDMRLRINQWADNLNKLIKTLQDKQTKLADLKTQQKTLILNLDREHANFEGLTRELHEISARFEAALREKNFTEKDFIDAIALADSGEADELHAKRKEIDENMSRTGALIDEIQKKLAGKLAERKTNQTLEEIKTLFDSQEKEITSLNEHTAVLRNKLENISSLQAKINDLEHEYSEQEKISHRWSDLNNLIGSAKGDEFRVFVQKITLSRVLKHANKYLEKINGRYRLILSPSDNNKLALSVIDNEQAGEVRPTTNLSGGERFIVSLALALGLSQISGSKARVDSLFLDEGFGSLDEESLNTALEALGEVRREGRMIGIISHVQALKDRIHAQINVIPQSSGTSIIEGPGCVHKTLSSLSGA